MAEHYVEADNKEEVNNEYVVEKILNKRIGENGQIFYYLKWQGWPESDSTWEPEEHCLCDNLIQEFEERQRKIQRENDASARLSRAGDQLLDTSDSDDNFDEYKKKNRRGEKTNKPRRRIAKFKIDSDDDDDDDGSDYEKSLNQSKKRRRKKGNKSNHESGYLSTDYLNDESTTTVDSDSSSAKSKKSKDSRDSVNSKVKKNRIIRENEAIQQILNSGGVGSSGRRSRDRSSGNSSDHSKKTMSSSSCAKESESKSITVQSYSSNREQPVVKQHRSHEDPPIKKPGAIQPIVKSSNSSKPPKESLNQTASETTRQSEQPIEREKLFQSNEVAPVVDASELIESLSLKRRCRISSSLSSKSSEESSDGDLKYEEQYFGWERGKKIVEVNDWRGYKEKILHLVRYEDGEEEYVDDFYTCTRYPSLTWDMYTKTAAAVKSEEHRVWYNYAIQRFGEFKEKGLHEDELTLVPVKDNQIPLDDQVKNNEIELGSQQNVTHDHSKTETNKNAENTSATTSECQGNKEPEIGADNFNFEFAVSNDEFDDERIIDQVIEEEMGNDENNQNYQNTDSGNSSSSGSRSVENTLSSELVVDSTQSESFHLHDSDFIIHSDSSFNASISSSQSQVYPEFEVTESDLEDCPTVSSETIRLVCSGPSPGESSNSQEDKQTIHRSNPSSPEIDTEFYFDPSSPSSVSIIPPIESLTNEHDSSLEAPDINNSDYSDLNEEDILFDPSPPSSPYYLGQG